jgi:hypothetical protein
MIKRLILVVFLISGFGLTTNAQIVTSQLNPGLNTKSPAASGWRVASAISFVYGTAEGDVSQSEGSGSMEKIGEVKYYGAAKGDGDTQPMPALQGVLKGEEFGLEVYMDNGIGVMKDVDFSYETLGATINVNDDQADKDLRVYFSWKPLEELSVGLGYRQNVFVEKLAIDGILGGQIGLDTEEEIKETETGIALVASYRLADIYYLAFGMENMEKEGEFERSTSTDLTGGFPSQSNAEYVENTWTNTYMGLGVVYGEPGDTQFRAEYSMISRPESDEAAEGGKLRNYVRKMDEIYATADVIYNNILLSYENRRYVYQKISEGSIDDSNKDRLDIVTLVGIGWVNPEGLSATLVSIDYKRVDEDAASKREFYPKGWGIYLSYKFN